MRAACVSTTAARCASPAIEPTATTKQALTSLLAGRDVTLRGTDDTPDRYGRQGALIFVGESDAPVQAMLLAQGDALVSAEIADKDCAAALMAAEAEARRQKKGNWADPSAIKNAESPDDILAGIGRFMVVEGKVLSVRQAGAMTYLNFGRNWTRGFAVTISKRTLPAFENAGITLKSLENQTDSRPGLGRGEFGAAHRCAPRGAGRVAGRKRADRGKALKGQARVKRRGWGARTARIG